MTDFNPDDLTTEVVVEQLKNIAETGDVEVPWTDLQRAIKTRLETVLESYKERSDCKEILYQEPNVEKFNLENSRDEILELIASFNEPPFTIQRICELLYSPFEYYDRISTFLRGLEKNLRVISSNDRPKIRIDPKIEGDASTNNIIDINSTNNNNINNNNNNSSSSTSSSNINNNNNDDADRDGVDADKDNQSCSSDGDSIKQPPEQLEIQQQSEKPEDIT